MKKKIFCGFLVAGLNFINLSTALAQDRVCADGQRSYFDVCPEDNNSRTLQNDPTPKPITKEINPGVTSNTQFNNQPASSLCRVGDKSDFFWPDDQTWYRGKVIDVKPNQCKVTYEGYNAEDDEWVGPERMRLLVLWSDGKKYAAKVLSRKGGKYLVTYEGYASSEDELVDLNQLSIKTK
jgi:hypothetical protein